MKFEPKYEHNLDARCPNCSRKAEFATGGAQAPRDGDLMICFKCAAIQVVTASGQLRSPTDEDRATWTDEDREALEEAAHIIRAGWRPE